MSPGFPASLFELLGRIIDAEVAFDETQSGPAPGENPFVDGRTDFGWICSTSFVDLASRAPDPTIERHIIERLGPWPVQPLVVRSTLDAAQVDSVRRLILDASDRDDVKAELDAAALSHFVEVGPDHYAAVSQAMQSR